MISRTRSKIGFLQNIVAAPFIALKVHPNIVSLLGLVFALIGAYYVYTQNWPLALLFFILAPLMDIADGKTARELKKVSNWGNYFETMIDKLIEFVMIGSFVFFFPFAVVLALGLSSIVSFAKPRVALIIITDNRDWPGIGEHAEKILLIIVAVAVTAVGYNFIEYFLYFIALISVIGLIQRMTFAKKLIKEAEKKGKLLPYIKQKKER